VQSNAKPYFFIQNNFFKKEKLPRAFDLLKIKEFQAYSTNIVYKFLDELDDG